MYYIVTINYPHYRTHTTSLERLKRESPDLALKDVLGRTVSVYRKNPEKYRKPPKSCGKMFDLSRPVETEVLSD